MPKNLLQNPIVIEYLMESPFYEVLDVLLAKYEIGIERQSELYDVTDAVIEGRLSLVDLPGMVEQAFGIDTEKAKELAIDLAGHRLLPIELFLPGVSEQIIAWGGNPDDYPKDRLTKTQLGAEDIVKRLVDSLLSDHGIELPIAMKNRLDFLLKGYLSGERDAAATKLMFTRGLNIGGMEMTSEVAGEVLRQVDALRGKVDVVDEGHEETSAAARVVLGEEEAVASMVVEGDFITAGGRREVKKDSSELGVRSSEKRGKDKEVEEEIDEEQIKDKSEEAVEGDQSYPLLMGEEKVIDAAVVNVDAITVRPTAVRSIAQQKPVTKPAKASFLPAKSVTHALTKKVPVIIGSILNDNEHEEVKVHVKRVEPAKKSAKDKEYKDAANDAYSRLGGITRSRRMTKVDFVKLAVAHIRGLKDPLRTEQQLKSQHGFNDEQIDRVMESLEIARKEVQERVGEIKKQVSRGRGIEGTEDFMKQEKVLLDQRHAALTQRVTDESIEPILPNARVSAARTKQEEINLQSSGLDEVAIKHAEAVSKPKKATVKVSQRTAPPVPRGKVLDVQYKKRLIGPIEQFGTMSTEEFRRLSNDAMQAIQKILDQFDTLKKEDYGQYIEGVKSWRKSPMNQLYIQMTQEALSQGIALTEVASARRNKGEESLSPREVQALMKLNANLCF